MNPDKDKMFRVGVISSTHGIHGEVKVYPTTDDINRFDYLSQVFVDLGKELKELEVEGVKYFKNMVILKFKGLDKIEDIEKWMKRDLLVTRENAIPLEEGEYYVSDLLGLPVFEKETGEKIGEMFDVMETGANNIYVIKLPNGKELLIPVIEDSCIDVSLEEQKITLHVLPGLL